MSKYLDRVMQGDERILYEAELHWIIYHVGSWTLLIGALIRHYGSFGIERFFGPKTAALAAEPLAVFALAIVAAGALQLVFAFIRQISTELVITNRRVIAKHGFIATTTYEVMLARVEGANTDQSIIGRILGFGTIMVRGTGGGISPIDHVARPYKFHSCLMQAMEESKHHDDNELRKPSFSTSRELRLTE